MWGDLEPSGRTLAAAVAALPGAALAGAWLVGDQSYTGPVDGGLDYAAHPWPLSSRTIPALGVAGSVTVLLAAWTLRRARRWLAVLACITAAGLLVGTAYRWMTAGVIGANLGFGFAILFLGPVAIGFLIAAFVLARPPRIPGTRQAVPPGAAPRSRR